MLADIQRSVGRIQGALQHMAASLERRARRCVLPAFLPAGGLSPAEWRIK
jgi:hypothetical protein